MLCMYVFGVCIIGSAHTVLGSYWSRVLNKTHMNGWLIHIVIITIFCSLIYGCLITQSNKLSQLFNDNLFFQATIFFT